MTSYLAELERKYIAALDQIKALEQEIGDLRAVVGKLSATPQIPMILRLTKREGRAFLALLARPSASKEQLLADMYADRYGLDEPEIKIVDVFVCKLRRKLKPFGLVIETQWGIGYSMPPETKDAVRRMNESAAEDSLRILR